MYARLAIRSAKRSWVDYLLYIAAMVILLAVTEVSGCIAVMGKTAGFQAASLPVLIAVILIALVGYINAFMLKQRARELANYLLLGMEKNRLSLLFLAEFFLIGCFCFLAGTAAGFALCRALVLPALDRGMDFPKMTPSALYARSLPHTFFYFCLVEAVCAFQLYGRIRRLQIRELMYEKKRNQTRNRTYTPKKWGLVFLASFGCLAAAVWGIAFLPEHSAGFLISVAAIPLFITVFAFYQWLFGFLYALRREKSASLYQTNRLYILAEITSDFQTQAVLNTVFCLCFLFSAMSFIVGRFMLRPELALFERSVQQWMGLVQVSLCVVFLVIYFSMLSLQQLIRIRQEAESLRILYYIGRSTRQLRHLSMQQTAVRLSLPLLVALPVFVSCVPLLNRKLNCLLPDTLHNILFRFTGEYLLCTFLFYTCYFLAVYLMSRRYME